MPCLCAACKLFTAKQRKAPVLGRYCCISHSFSSVQLLIRLKMSRTNLQEETENPWMGWLCSAVLHTLAWHLRMYKALSAHMGFSTKAAWQLLADLLIPILVLKMSTTSLPTHMSFSPPVRLSFRKAFHRTRTLSWNYLRKMETI